jgi:hypothetical protein
MIKINIKNCWKIIGENIILNYFDSIVKEKISDFFYPYE